ncbi:cytochrome b [Vibrio owensii]|uniref:cytochrome b n=1 Tax=Vibrio owensii TaxID=696485 RepID=UPI0018F20019|nr:cytochrome b/b6 domain-containing protein [Vibrio owensii]
MDTKDKLSKVSLVLHWVVGVLMIYMILSGLTMESLEVRWFFDSHTSLGVLIVVVVIPRIIWRYYNGWPEAMGSYSKLEKIAGKVVHWTLLLCTILMPASGMLLAVAGGHGLHIFALEVLPEVYDPNNPDETLVLYPRLQELSIFTHYIIGQFILPAALLLHIAGALKHHFLDKDKTLLRILGK